MSRDAIPLPAPYEHVHVIANEFGWGVLVEYVADNPDDLVAAGAAPPVIMADRRRKYDEAGNLISIKKKPRKDAPNRVLVTRWIRKGDARSLPGVREYLERAQRQPRNSSRSEWLTSLLCDAAGVFGNVPVRPRHAIVGRLQRPVDYVTAGDLIIPDWVRIQALVTVNRKVRS